MDRTRLALVALNAHPVLPRAAICRLALDAGRWLGEEPSPALAATLGVSVRQLALAASWCRDPGRVAEPELSAAERLGARVVVLGDPEYPGALLDLALPPPVLSIRGTLPASRGVAIVGSRAATAYGTEVAAVFARALSAGGVPVVSGLARGVDHAAHRAALEPPDGTTVAVLGCGLAVRYPLAHQPLREAITARGAVLSEHPCEAPPLGRNFPIRNRIIAALAHAVLVVEAATRSGSLVTARHALDLGREVWAVPGRIFDETATGTNALLADGASLARDPRDLLPDGVSLPLFPATPSAPGPQPTGAAGRLLAALVPGDPQPVESLAAAAGLAVEAALAGLLELELDGWARRHPGPLYDRRA